MREKGRQIAESFCKGRREEDLCAKTERRGFLFIDFFNGPDPFELDSIQWLGEVLCIWVMDCDGEVLHDVCERASTLGLKKFERLDLQRVYLDRRLGRLQVSIVD
jgi:hypothetical protein